MQEALGAGKRFQLVELEGLVVVGERDSPEQLATQVELASRFLVDVVEVYRLLQVVARVEQYLVESLLLQREEMFLLFYWTDW